MNPILHEFLRDPTPYLRSFTKTIGRRKDIKRFEYVEVVNYPYDKL